jgi:DEAD/DEAH box helicase domain-containing protein
VHVTSQVVGFKKIKFHTNENVGSGELTMPENEMHTTAYWLTVPREVMGALPYGLEERRDGIVALSYTLGQLAALFLMCDRHDLGVALGDNGQGEARIERGLLRLGAGRREEPLPGEDYEPNIFVYDAYPGGIGLSEPLYRLHDRLLAESRALIAACACKDGCPSCVGPAGEVGSNGKEVALAILDGVMHARNPSGADSERSVRSGRPR